MRARAAPGLRNRLLAAVALAVLVALVVLTVSFNLVLRGRLSADANEVLRSRAGAELASLVMVDGRLVAREAPDDAALDSRVWVFAGRRVLEHPQGSASLDPEARRLAADGRRTVELGDTRLLAVPVVRDRRRLGTVVAGISMKPYRRTARLALVASVIGGALALVGVLVLARWLLARALRPVARMTSQAAEWSEHDLDRRFALGAPHDELTALAATLDGLLARLAAGMRREQRFSAEMSHELRTPLAKLRAEAELALRHERSPERYREALAVVVRQADRMTAAVETLMAAARHEAGEGRGRAGATDAAMRALDACAPLAQERGIEVTLDGPVAPATVGASADVVERILVPVIENACRYGRSHVGIEIRTENGAVSFAVDDDGPGVAPGEQDRIFEPGTRGSAGRGDGGAPGGAGLGLALARRLARAAGGDVLVATQRGGGRFEVRLPAA